MYFKTINKYIKLHFISKSKEVQLQERNGKNVKIWVPET